MRRILVALAAVALLAVGSVAIANAQDPTPTPTPKAGPQGWMWLGWGWFGGKNDPANNPTVKRVADKLGISAQDLISELKAGKSVADVAGEKNVDLQALVDTILAPQSEVLQIGVKYGYISQEQADKLLKNMQERIRKRLEKKGSLNGLGGGRGWLGPGLGPRGGPAAPNFAPRFRGPGI